MGPVDEKPLEQIQGTVEDVVYHNEDTGFTVLAVSVEDELITVVGETPDIAEGEEVTASGRYGVHPSYGVQFKAQLIERTLPSTANAIARYLASGAIKGIGPALARRIVALFGDKTLEVMERDPLALTQVRGISHQKALAAGEEYARLFGIRTVMLFLTAQGIAPALAIKIWKRWGPPAVELIRCDPYVLCQDEIGLPFEDADRMADAFGLGADSYRRMSAGMVYILRHNARQGHVCLPREKLLSMAAEFLELPRELLEDRLEDMLQDNTLALYTAGGRDYLYGMPLYRAESYVAGRIGLMLRMAPPPGLTRKEDTLQLEAVEQQLGLSYDPLQRQAILEAMDSPVFILTGGPGTGKTTTLRGMLALLEARGEKFALAAPTGRAAKRMTEVTGYEAKTIHRLLEVEPFQPSLTFKRNEKNPLPADVILVDEMSMVDILILESLFRGLRLGSRLILVGDSDQLPSVSAGNVLGDLIAGGMVPTLHLDTIFRQAQESLIVTGAHAIVRGDVPNLDARDRDFFFLETRSPLETRDLVADLCARRLPQSYGYSPLWDIQVMTPGKQGAVGTRELNRLLQQRLNPPDPQRSQMESFGRILREGDKVMQVRNNYDVLWTTDQGDQGQGIFNGDIGVIEMIDPSSKTILVKYDNQLVPYTFEAADQLEHAYAITIHKSQGSEFEAVILPVLGSHPNLHYRNLLYTGFTRAKTLLILAGSRETVAAMVRNNRRTRRYTNLRAMLEEQCQALASPVEDAHPSGAEAPHREDRPPL